MTAPNTLFPRRAMLGLAAAGACALLPRRAAAEQIALAGPVGVDAPTMTVAGPGDSDAAHWARLLQVPLAAGLLAPDGVQLRFVGGRDGVTGLNQFDARAMPDGTNAVLFPGNVGLALLSGDSRVRFDAAHFLPVMAAIGPGVVMMRGGLPARRGMPVRLACQEALDPAASALLALDLLEVPALPVDAGADTLQAARSGAADAVFVRGDNAPAQIRALAEAGLAPAFRVGFPGGPAQSAPAPMLMDLLSPGRRADPLVAAWHGLAAASVTDMVLAVPRLSPSGAVARWQTACRAGMDDPAVIAEARARGAGIVCDSAAAQTMAAMLVPEDAQTALRGWLGVRLNWQPS